MQLRVMLSAKSMAAKSAYDEAASLLSKKRIFLCVIYPNPSLMGDGRCDGDWIVLSWIGEGTLSEDNDVQVVSWVMPRRWEKRAVRGRPVRSPLPGKLGKV